MILHSHDVIGNDVDDVLKSASYVLFVISFGLAFSGMLTWPIIIFIVHTGDNISHGFIVTPKRERGGGGLECSAPDTVKLQTTVTCDQPGTTDHRD